MALPPPLVELPPCPGGPGGGSAAVQRRSAGGLVGPHAEDADAHGHGEGAGRGSEGRQGRRDDRRTPADDETPAAEKTPSDDESASEEPAADEPTEKAEPSATPEDSESPSDEPSESRVRDRPRRRRRRARAVEWPPRSSRRPPATTPVITVKVGGDRIGVNGVDAARRASCSGFYAAATGGTRLSSARPTSTATAASSCRTPSLNPPAGNRDRQFWVRQISAPTRYYTNPTLRTGQSTRLGTERLRTASRPAGARRPAHTYSSTGNFMIGTGARQQRRRPAESGRTRGTTRTFPAKCGLDVALVLDLSGLGGRCRRPAAKAAANTFRRLPGRHTVADVAFLVLASVTPLGATQNYPP